MMSDFLMFDAERLDKMFFDKTQSKIHTGMRYKGVTQR